MINLGHIKDVCKPTWGVKSCPNCGRECYSPDWIGGGKLFDSDDDGPRRMQMTCLACDWKWSPDLWAKPDIESSQSGRTSEPAETQSKSSD